MTPEAFFGQDDVPGEVLIGELFTFKVRFKNTGSSIGYAPFIDLAMDARGADYNAADPLANPSVPLPCDGIEFVSASMVDVNGGPLTLTSLTDWNAAACVNGSLPSSVAHPYGNTAGPVNLVSDGWQLVTMALPFGSFDPSQPEVVVEVTARMHDYADISPLLPPHPLKIYARGGFRSATALPGTPMVQFGNTPHLDGWADATIEPTVLTVQKTYSGPEDEAVAGPNFITYYPLKYTIVVDIAEGHTIHNLHVTDILPAQVQFAGNVLVTVLGAQAGPVTQCGGMSPGFPVLITTPSTSTPGGTLDVTLCDPITGQPLMTDEVVIEFEFYIPGAVLDADCDPSPVTVTNDVAARGDWDPSDPRDAPPNTTVPVFSDLTQDDHVLSAKCLAIQKSVEAPPGGPRPGDVLKYTLKFQISDYHTIGQLLVTDVLGDGQDFLTAPPATLRVTDQFGTSGGPASPPSIAFPPGTVSITPDVNAAAQRCGPELQQPPGGTILEFNVSGAMALVTQSPPGIPRHSAGILTGGYAALPVPTAPLTTAAEGEIIFYAQIRDLYAFPVGPGNPVVDKHDPINNCVEISGDVLANTLATTVPSSQVIGLAEDDSSTQTAIVTDILKKSVYAIRRGTSTVCGPTGPACASPPSAPSVLPDDQVTFRLEYSIPAGDAENVVLNDWLPLPFFEVGDPDADGTPGPVWSPVPATPLLLCPGGLPAPGVACELPTNTLLSGANPFTFMPDFATNSLNFNYFSFNNTANTPLTIDVLFTLTVTNTPYADGLHVTNEVQECESNTFGLRLCQTAIAPMVVREPVLAIRKGVVATSNANGVFSPPLTPNVWLPYGAACPRFNTSTPISSLTLQGFGSDLSNVDASDWVTFAIVIENTGGAPAYHISLKDMIPEDVLLQPTCFEPNWGGLCVHYGNGAAIPFTTTGPLPGTGGGRGITFDPSAPLLPGSPLNTAGTNIAIITFNAQMLDKDTLLSGCCDNKAELISYTSTFQGPGPGMPPNFVGAGLGGPFVDTAKVCVGPTAVLKCVQTTSEIHTMQQSGSTVDAAIGEIVRFRLVTAIPEGTTQGFKVTDLLPPGLTYLPNTASVRFVANSPVTSSAMAWPTTANQQFATCGPAMPFNNVAVGGGPFQWGSGTDPIFFLLGTTPYTIKNNDPPSDADLEYAVVEFSAQVDNIPGNVAGLSLTDRFQVDYKDAAGNPNPPSLSAPADVHVVEPTLTISKTVSPASIQQYGTLLYTVDVVNTGSAGAFDIVITDVLPPSLQLGMVTMPGVCTNSSGGNTVSIYCPHLDALTMMQITYEALTLIPCPATVQNRATVTWTSLPGPGGTCASSLTLCTAGPSGAINGERNGSTVHPPYPLTSPPVPNNYWAGGSASLDVTCPPVAKLCIYKFEDRDGDGLYEPNAPDNEPLVPGWPFNVSPGIGNVTLPQGMWCFTVAPGTYTVNELPHPTNPAGWTLTTANPQTATILTQPVDLFFGNQRAPQCDLAIKKTTDPMPVVAGQQFAFVVKVTNVGTATCPGPTTVTDILPAAFTMSANGWYPQTTGGWVCNAPPNISCTNSQPLQPNVPSTVFIVAGTWAPGTTLLNCATIQQSPGDINPVNDSDCITLAPTPTPEPTPAGCLPCARVLLPITYNNRQHGATDTPSPGGTPLATETATPAPTPSASDVPSPTVLPPTVTVPTTATNTTTVTPSPPRPTTPALTATLTPTIRPTTTRTNTPVPTVPLTPTATSTLRPVSATSSPTAPPMGCAPLTTLPGLVAWWKLEGNQGEVIEDIIYRPMLNDGILFGWPFTWGQGQVGQALAFNGTTTYIDVPDDASLDFAASPAGDFSIDMWVKLPTTANTSGVRVLVAKQASSGGPGYQLYLYNAQPGIQLADSGGYTNINASQAIPKDNQWHLLVLSVDRDQATGGVFYLDGVQIGNAFDPTVRSGSLENAALLRIGAQSFQVGALFDGWLDEVEVFRSALSAAAVTRLYQAANVGKCTPTQPPPSLASAGPNWPSSWRPSAARSANLR